MKTSLVTKLSIAVAATMLTLSPALAHGKPSHHGHGYSHGHSKYAHGKHKHARKFHKPRRHVHHRRWKPRFHNAWRYGYRPYRAR